VVKTVKWAALYLRLRRIYLGIKRDPQRLAYADVATSAWDEADPHELFASEAAQAYVGEQRRLQDIRSGGAIPLRPMAPAAGA
jgi:hypothetical protein